MKGFVNLTHTNNKKIADLRRELETKQANKPDGQTELVSNETGKIDDIYLPNEVIGVDAKLASKQDKRPNGQTDLINAQTGKLDNTYLPSIISGTSRIFAGTFGEDGVIMASAYASELNGININLISVADCIGYEFLYTGETDFHLENFYSEEGLARVMIVSKNDVVVCNGKISDTWVLYDNSDKVVSVNGQTGAVNLDIPQAGIEQLVGTEDKPINLATDMEVGHLYSCDGYIYGHNGSAVKINGSNILIYKYDSTRAFAFGMISGSTGFNESRWSSSIIVFASDDGRTTAYGNYQYIEKLNGGSPTNTGGANIFAPTTAGTQGQVLTSAGSGAPVWSDLPAGGIEQLVGTEEKPINLINDLEIGKLNFVNGYVYINESKNQEIPYTMLCYKIYDDTVLCCDYGYRPNAFFSNVGGVVGVKLNSSGALIRTSGTVSINNLNSETSGSNNDTIYAPTASGTAGQILQSNGNTPPTWIDFTQPTVTRLI